MHLLDDRVRIATLCEEWRVLLVGGLAPGVVLVVVSPWQANHLWRWRSPRSEQAGVFKELIGGCYAFALSIFGESGDDSASAESKGYEESEK